MKDRVRGIYIYGVCLFIILIVSFSGCKKDSPTEPVVPGPIADKVTYEVEYSATTRVFSGTKKEALEGVDSTGTIFTFNAQKLGEVPNAGDIIIVHGLYMRKVISVNNTGSQLIITTEDATLTEAIKNGKLEWQYTPKVSQITNIMVGGKEIQLKKTLASGFTYEFDLGNWHYVIWMNPNGQSATGQAELQVNFAVTNHAIAGGKITATLGAKGSMRLPQQAANINISNNALSGFKCNNSSMRSELTLEYAAAFSEGGGQAILELPSITMRVPLEAIAGIPIPLPIFITFGISFNTIINLPSVTANAFGKCKLVLDSNTGFEFTGTGFDTEYKLNDQDVGELNWEVGDLSLMPAPLEVRHELSAPKVGLEIAGSEVLWASCVYGTRSTLMVPSLCKAAMDQVRIDYGYNIGALGISLAQGGSNLWHVTKEYYSPECN